MRQSKTTPPLTVGFLGGDQNYYPPPTPGRGTGYPFAVDPRPANNSCFKAGFGLPYISQSLHFLATPQR